MKTSPKDSNKGTVVQTKQVTLQVENNTINDNNNNTNNKQRDELRNKKN